MNNDRAGIPGLICFGGSFFLWFVDGNHLVLFVQGMMAVAGTIYYVMNTPRKRRE